MKGKILPVLIGILLLGVGAVVGRSLDTPSSVVPSSTPTPYECKRAAIDHDNIMVLVNEYRLEKGLTQLQRDGALDAYAQARAEEIVTNKDLTHQTKLGTFSAWMQKNVKPADRLEFKGIGEVLTQATDGVITPDACGAVESWKASPTHNNILLKPEFIYMGIGIKDQTVTVELAGDPDSETSPTPSASASSTP